MIRTTSLINLDANSASAFIQLLNELLQKKVTLFLGAGVSASMGIPTWNQLIEQICSTFFYHWEFSENSGTNSIPKNLLIRMSSHRIDQKPVKFWPWTSTVSTGDFTCPASKQGNQCKSCRNCWNREVANVSYPKH